MPEVGVVGYGVVGQATARLFEGAAVYDPPKGYHHAAVLAGCPVVFVCLPTPAVDRRYDLSAIHDALDAVAPWLDPAQVVCIRSTVLPGTVRALSARYPGVRFASNPEFLRAHRAFADAAAPYRVVIGADREGIAREVRQAYARRLPPDTPFVLTDSTTAEMIKCAANAYLAVKIAGAHEVWDACRTLGIDYETVRRGLSLDPRIGDEGELAVDEDRPGFDDECLPKDLEAFTAFLAAIGHPGRIARAAAAANTEYLQRRPALDGMAAWEDG